MGRTKPLYGESAAGIVDIISLPETTLGRILAGIEFDLNADQEIILLDACETFIEEKKFFQNFPRGSNVRAALMALEKKMKRPGQMQAILRMISEMDTRTRSMIATRESLLDLYQLTFQLEMFDSAVEGSFLDMDLLTFQLEQLGIAVEASLASIDKDKGGPTPKDGIALGPFVRTLAELFESATRKPAVSGFRHDGMSEESGSEFFIFVETCLTILGHRPQSRAALGKSIERILK